MRFHLHWIANSTIAIRDFAKIPSGTLITLHDEWLISGSSHYAPDKGAAIERGRRRLLNPLASFLDRRVYARKKKAFSGRDDLVVTVPSAWMKRRVEASGVFDGAIVKVIPNGVDTEQFAPASDKRCDARGDLGISEEDFLICFGADHSARNPIKGTDLFLELLSIIAHTPEQFKRVSLVVVGGLQVAQPSGGGVRIIDAGQIRNREALANLFRASDVLLHLSRLEAFGLVPCEAMSCGTPVICFDNTGASELVIDGETGFVCAPFEVQAVADAISDLIAAGPTVRTQMSAAARKHMVSHYSLEKLSERYGDLLKEEAQTK
nr:glycosyltransferase [uncultured Celeribacter sp.]